VTTDFATYDERSADRFHGARVRAGLECLHDLFRAGVAPDPIHRPGYRGRLRGCLRVRWRPVALCRAAHPAPVPGCDIVMSQEGWVDIGGRNTEISRGGWVDVGG